MQHCTPRLLCKITSASVNFPCFVLNLIKHMPQYSVETYTLTHEMTSHQRLTSCGCLSIQGVLEKIISVPKLTGW